MWPKYFNKTPPELFLSLILLVIFSPNVSAADTLSNNPVFARVNGRTITYNEFMDIFHTAVRYKYYHGEVPKKELATFQRKVGKDIIDQILLYQEALKLGLKPDTKSIQAGLAEYDKKYANKREWQTRKEKNMPLLLERLERQNLIEQMQFRIKSIGKPNLTAVQTFYKKNPEKFTEPARVWVSVLLLSVPPSSPKQTWLNADKAARQFIERIKQGENFTDIARKYSAHPSAVNGGDLGYLHQGMLQGDARNAVDKLKINELSAPVRVLEGITVFRLNGIQKAKLKPFNEVKQRAADLLYRELQNVTWQNYLNKLTQSADIFVNEKLYASANER